MEESSELVSVKDLTVARRDFSQTVAALKQQCQDSRGNGSLLTKVRTEDEGWFWNSTHEVTGDELNKLITQIQGVMTKSADQRRLLWNSLIEVYGTLNTLDAEYLSKIDKSFDLINANYEKIKANNQEIRRSQSEIETHSRRLDQLIDGHETALKVLQKFKARIDKLSHLEDMDELVVRLDNALAAVEADSSRVAAVLEELETHKRRTRKAIWAVICAITVTLIIAIVAL